MGDHTFKQKRRLWNAPNSLGPTLLELKTLGRASFPCAIGAPGHFGQELKPRAALRSLGRPPLRRSGAGT